MKIQSAEFIRGIKGTDPILYDRIPQIAFFGRSNVGKSSVINALVNRTNLVRVGKKPGKTISINFFLVNKQFYFVDLPGYGYMAKLNQEEKEKIRKLILWYVMYSEVKPHAIVLVLDVNVGFTPFDKEFLEILKKMNRRYIIIANKIDKLNQKEMAGKLESIAKESGHEDILLCSAKTKAGITILLQTLLQ